MKIDFDMLEKLVDAGASAKVVVAMLKEQDQRFEAKRKRDKEAKIIARATSSTRATTSDNERQNRSVEDDKRRHKATLDDTPRARLYREGAGALIALGRTDRAARALISQWLKLTHDDDQLVLATILRARDLAVADVAGWVLGNLKGKTNGKQNDGKSILGAIDRLEEQLQGSDDRPPGQGALFGLPKR